MAKTVMTVKTDEKLKKEAQEVAEEMGFPLGTLVNAFLRQFVRNKTVFVTLHTGGDGITVASMNKMLEKQLREIEKDIRKEKHLSPSFSTMEAALKYLKKK